MHRQWLHQNDPYLRAGIQVTPFPPSRSHGYMYTGGMYQLFRDTEVCLVLSPENDSIISEHHSPGGILLNVPVYVFRTSSKKNRLNTDENCTKDPRVKVAK
ncbi:hypothetical protein Y1Q_0014969 [Alligator mississippiensis]|uniref:Uncharacterized protein n=1 Tax=Alligator mississippiensis TaxID=8496 RepID=A0A151N8S7_ALLMI|nr:hypothetical protein Y1Q_0014969 [Alligator mississippiensis]